MPSVEGSSCSDDFEVVMVVDLEGDKGAREFSPEGLLYNEDLGGMLSIFLVQSKASADLAACSIRPFVRSFEVGYSSPVRGGKCA